jgi:hypothetical protein
MAAVTSEQLRKVVVRGEPFQSTVAPDTNPEPWMSRVSGPDPDGADGGLRLMSKGGTTVGSGAVTVITWVQALLFPHESVAVQVRVRMLLQGLPGRVWVSVNVTTGVTLQLSTATRLAGGGTSLNC